MTALDTGTVLHPLGLYSGERKSILGPLEIGLKKRLSIRKSLVFPKQEGHHQKKGTRKKSRFRVLLNTARNDKKHLR